MGALHDGHMALVDAARARAACVVMSIFVNPLQFAPSEDFAAYPRDVDADTAKARARGVDMVFVPTVEEMYPTERVVTVTPGDAAGRWEGAARPGHFAGVLTVVAKLFHIVQPDVAVFGQKDAQQVMLIRAMVRDLDFPTEILVAPTVREPDGLAMSSRNAYLSPDERREARVLSAALRAMHEAWRARDVRDASALDAVGRGVLQTEPGVAVEYLGVAEPRTLAPAVTVEPGHVAMIAARVGRTRLIDNLTFTR